MNSNENGAVEILKNKICDDFTVKLKTNAVEEYPIPHTAWNILRKDFNVKGWFFVNTT